MYSIMNWHYIHYEIINTVSLKGKPLHRTSYVIFKRPVWNENVSLKAVNTELFPLFLGLSKQVMAIYFICYVYVHGCMLSCFSHVWLFVTPWTVTYQAPLSMGFSRQEYGSGLPFPSAGDLANPRTEPVSLMSPALQASSLSLVLPEKPHFNLLFNVELVAWEYSLLFVAVFFSIDRALWHMSS